MNRAYALGLAAAVVLSFASGWALQALLDARRRRAAARTPAAVTTSSGELARHLLGVTRGVVPMPRYLIEVVDQVAMRPGDPQMRWQWRVWDADQELRLVAYPDSDEDPDGETGMGGVPFMVGNTSTEAFATLNAARWCRDHGRKTFVLGAVEEDRA